MNNGEKNIHLIRRFIDKRTENTLKNGFMKKIIVLTIAVKAKML